MENYRFYGRLTQGFPSQINVDLTELCNYACLHCPHSEFKRSDHFEGKHLDKDLHAKMVDEVREFGKGKTMYIRYTSNGEPLLHPHIIPLLDYAVKNSGTFVTLTTNGSLINEKKVRELVETGINLIDVSLDAFTQDVYSKVRVNGNLDTTRENILNLLSYIKQTRSNTKVVVSFVEQELNKHEVKPFKEYWEKRGVNDVVIRRLHSAAGAKETIAKKLNVIEAERRPCLYPWERITLNAKGFLNYCPADWSGGSNIIDYRNTTIKETWTGDFYTSLREAHLNNDYSNCTFCGQCPDWINTRWPDEGRSYANLVSDLKR